MFKLLIAVVFLGTFSSYAFAAKASPTVIMPAGSAGSVPVVVWLQGYRGYPGLIEEPFLKEISNAYGVAFVGFPATTDLGDDTQQWSEEPVADHAYIQDQLKKLRAKHPLSVDRVALIGFSQGAMVAADLCVRYPSFYSGAVIMSPGGIGNPSKIARLPFINRNQGFVLTCMAKEHPGNVELTRWYAEYLKELSDKVVYLEYPDVSKHTRPADLNTKLPGWLDIVLAKPTK